MTWVAPINGLKYINGFLVGLFQKTLLRGGLFHFTYNDRLGAHLVFYHRIMFYHNLCLGDEFSFDSNVFEMGGSN